MADEPVPPIDVPPGGWRWNDVSPCLTLVALRRDQPRCRFVCPHGDRCALWVGHGANVYKGHGDFEPGIGCNHRRCFCNDANVEMPELRVPSGKGVLLRCSWCQREQLLDVGATYTHREGAELLLYLMTGGWRGKPIGEIAYQPTVDDFANAIGGAGMSSGFGLRTVGKSECCGTQLDGELYGYGP